MLTGARVTRLATAPGGRTIERVEVERDGAREVYTADVVVVAAGAINSAALLLASANDAHPHGLGNRSGMVGRNLMLHNNSSLIAISRTPNPTTFQKTLGINDFYFGDGEWEFPLGAIQMLGKSDAYTMSLDAPDADDPADLAARSLDFWLTTEDLPVPENRVELGTNGQVKLTYTPTNLEAHDRLKARFRSLLDTMRCRDEVIGRHTYLGGRLGISGVAHQNGTTRFGTDPATSVLDVNCRLHDVDNAYVVDGGFFVSSAAVNPTLTIIANALRVADHLAQRLG
jgi:choline dehydrogenase-like flavoprotein